MAWTKMEITNFAFLKFSTFWVGLSNGNIPDGEWLAETRNYYDYGSGLDYCSFGGHKHPFEWPNGAIKPEWNGRGDVIGCGLMQSPQNKLAIFFTANGILMGQFFSCEIFFSNLIANLQASKFQYAALHLIVSFRL
jgi:hypothetical protein